jgi:uncharacterized Zn-binding protein involved in type VI secretion
MNRPLIVMGDKTSHGGSVISADMTSDLNGKYMARVNDMTVCPKCKGIFAITSGADDMKDGAGNSYARHGDSTACGAKLLSAQDMTYWGSESSMGDPAAADRADALAAASQIAAVTSSGVCLDCLLKAATSGGAVVVRE